MQGYARERKEPKMSPRSNIVDAQARVLVEI